MQQVLNPGPGCSLCSQHTYFKLISQLQYQLFLTWIWWLKYAGHKVLQDQICEPVLHGKKVSIFFPLRYYYYYCLLWRCVLWFILQLSNSAWIFVFFLVSCCNWNHLINIPYTVFRFNPWLEPFFKIHNRKRLWACLWGFRSHEIKY